MSTSPTIDVRATIESFPLKRPFSITGYTFTDADVLTVEIDDGTVTGRGEGCGVYYLGDTVEKAKERIDAIADRVRAGISRDELIELLPAGGARNALDAALWDLEAKRARVPAWKIAGLPGVKPLRTTYTIGAGEPAEMAQTARSYVTSRAIKLKLTGTPEDAQRVRAVREARPDVWIGVDANQGFTRTSLAALMPALLDANVGMIEQPFPRLDYEEFDGLQSPIPIAADESALDVTDLPKLVDRVDVVNIKLDKCGGLTRGLQMAAGAKRLGMRTMVGCMAGTSLSMAAGFILAQLCDFVDLDGPISLARDREPSVVYAPDGTVFSPPELWGYPTAIVQRS
jgi:L-Ala-D/L-Glu epimerase